MIFEINSLRIRPGEEAAFESAFPKAAMLLRSVPGCRSARLFRCIEQPRSFHIEIGWDRIEDHRDHYPQTDQAARVRELLLPLIENADIGHYELVSTT